MDYKEEYKKYLDVTKDNFKEKWGNLNFVEEDKDVVINKWLAIHDVFFDFTKYSDKSKNIWFNEIREIALFNLFNIDPEELNVLDVLNGDGLDDTKEKLKGLHEEWTSTVLECAEKETGGDYTINSFTKKGGQGTSHDFELSVTSETNEMKVKIEFKFSNSKSTSVADLAEFAALNTESASSFILFKNDNKPMSYLNYFWDEKYLKDMCSTLNLTEEETPKDKKTWMTTAKSVAVPKSGPTKIFHERLREADVTSNKEKKNLVNKSFDEFIQLCTPGFEGEKRKEEIASIFNGKQEGKYFCIFNKGGFTIDSVPKIVITGFRQDTKKKHVFYLECKGNISIQCGMSWGNGGAGNQNPRILFKLILGEVEPPVAEPFVEPSLESESKVGLKNADEFIAEPPEIESTDEVPQSESKSYKQRAEFIEEAVKVGGEGEEDGSCDDESCDKDWFIYDEELAIGDTLGKKERDQLLEITNTEKDVTKKIDKEESNQLLEMKLRSGKILKGPEKGVQSGGKKRSKKVKTGQKTKKRTKIMKKKKLFVLIRTKKGNQKFKKTKKYCRK